MNCIAYKVRVCEDGTKEWRLNGLLHRVGAPAIEYADGRKYWYLNGVNYSEEEWKAEFAKQNNSCGW